jgi:hypothetical protein
MESMAMDVSFVRHRERRDRVYVTRGDGSSTAWDFPSYGDRLPHDLCHLVVEEGLGIVEGFWGLVDRGFEVKFIDDHATLVRHGRPLVEEVGVDFSDLMRAEEAVALLGPTAMGVDEVGGLVVMHLDATSTGVTDGDDLGMEGLRTDMGFDLPAGVPAETIASVRQRLAQLAGQWRELGDGDAITLTYTGPS